MYKDVNDSPDYMTPTSDKRSAVLGTCKVIARRGTRGLKTTCFYGEYRCGIVHPAEP